MRQKQVTDLNRCDAMILVVTAGAVAATSQANSARLATLCELVAVATDEGFALEVSNNRDDVRDFGHRVRDFVKGNRPLPARLEHTNLFTLVAEGGG